MPCMYGLNTLILWSHHIALFKDISCYKTGIMSGWFVIDWSVQVRTNIFLVETKVVQSTISLISMLLCHCSKELLLLALCCRWIISWCFQKCPFRTIGREDLAQNCLSSHLWTDCCILWYQTLLSHMNISQSYCLVSWLSWWWVHLLNWLDVKSKWQIIIMSHVSIWWSGWVLDSYTLVLFLKIKRDITAKLFQLQLVWVNCITAMQLRISWILCTFLCWNVLVSICKIKEVIRLLHFIVCWCLANLYMLLKNDVVYAFFVVATGWHLHAHAIFNCCFEEGLLMEMRIQMMWLNLYLLQVFRWWIVNLYLWVTSGVTNSIILLFQRSITGLMLQWIRRLLSFLFHIIMIKLLMHH